MSRCRSGERSRMATAVIVERRSGSFSMVHMSASASLIRLSYRRVSLTISTSHTIGRSVQGRALVVRGVAVDVGAHAGGRHPRALPGAGVRLRLRPDVDEVGG